MPDDATDVAPDAPAARPRPPALLVVLAGVALEALALVVVALVLVWHTVSGSADGGGLAIGLAVFALCIVALLVAGARGLWNGRRIGRAPVFTWQLLQLVVGIGAIQAGSSLWGVPLVVVAAVLIVGLVLRPVVEHTTG